MRAFRWVSADTLPAAQDLRLFGWRLIETDESAVGCVAIVDTVRVLGNSLERLLFGVPTEARHLILLIGVNSVDERVEFFGQGFGDAVADDCTTAELDARARRLAALSNWVPRSRVLAGLSLNLMGREAAYNGRSLALGPREFAMLWRLADTPDLTVSKQALVDDVWRLGVVPESNSLAVQISRMRGKLAAVGLAGLIETVAGGYRLQRAVLEPELGVLR